MKRCILTLLALSLCCCVSAQSVFRLHYWFDDQFADGITVTSSNGSWQSPIEASHLSDGFHTFYVQVQDSTGQWFSPSSYLFYRLPDTVREHQVRYTCWFDEDYEHTQSDSVSVGNFLLDASSLATGFHTVNFQFNFSNTVSFKSYLFYKSTSLPSANDSVEYVFWFDQDFEHRHSGRFLSEHLVFDIDSLPTGFHTFNAQFKSGEDVTIKSFLFYKKPHAEIQIVRYEYWLNDLDSLAQVVDLTPQDIVNLVALLQLAPQPIRSTYFHFNPNNGIPVVNAKNDIHFRFYNAEGRQANKTMPYVDITVVDTIHADTLERDTTKVVMVPTGNEIHWFKLSAGVGDSLSFHTDKLCTMQLFAPSGAEIMKVKGQNCLTWKGCHSWESGDYYLAVHDVDDTGTIAVSYQWIYRYAVLAWDVHRVGNGGLSTITFEGNGFASLDTVYLIKGLDSIPALYIGRESNTTTAVIFNFENIDTGMYRAVFMYEEENLYKSNVVYVEEVRPIVLTTTCSYPETFLRGSTVTYTYTITNTGNMTAYNVPLYIYMATAEFGDISNIVIDGLALESFYDYITSLDSLSLYNLEQLKKYSDSIGDDFYFSFSKDIAEDGVDSISVRSSLFFKNIAPYSTLNINVNITATSTIETYMSVPDSWEMYSNSSINVDSLVYYLITNNNKSYCCWHNAAEAMLNTASLTAATTTILLICCGPEAAPAALVSGAISCVFGTSAELSSQISSVVCNHEAITWKSFALSALKIAIGCVSSTAKVLGISLNLGSIAFNGKGVWNNISDQRNVSKSLDCNPPPKGGVSVSQVPVDPNEITGYVAESGSFAVGVEQMQLPYMIEFENDTVFATTHANTVVVRDTLDGSVFDLNSFSAGSFAIGEEVTSVNGGQSFIRTVDMRPSINVLAQVQLDYHIDSTFAVATWTFSSLDPMTLQPTMADTLGFLGIGGTGEVNFAINRKTNLPDSTLIDNRAWITFDNEDPIATSTWRNIVDITPPVSSIDSIAYLGETAIVEINATDNLSGVWRYHVYAQLSDDVLLPVALNIPIDSAVSVVPPVGTVQLHSAAVDSAGNVENVGIIPPCATIYDTIVTTACDSYTWFDSVYTVSGDYVHVKTVTSLGRCDTITTLQLTVNVATTSDTTATACDSFAWHGTTFTASTNTPTFTTQNAMGCDSTVTLHLTINNSTTGDTSAMACDTFTWWNNVYTNSTDTPIHTYTNLTGCDSTVTLHLTINNSTIGDTSAVACDTFTWWNNVYTNSTNTPTHTYNSVAGCDSTVTLHLTINHSVETTVTDTSEGSYSWHDFIYTESGTYQWNGTTSAGCDSTVTLILVINQIGIEVIDETGMDIVVYPNPTTGKLTIDADGVLLVEVLDQTGHKVATYEQTNRIDLGGLPVGGYLLKIHLSKGISIQRVLLK